MPSLADKSSRTEVCKCSLQGAGGSTSLYVQPVRAFLLTQGVVFIWGIYCTVGEAGITPAWQLPDGEGDCEWDQSCGRAFPSKNLLQLSLALRAVGIFFSAC